MGGDTKVYMSEGIITKINFIGVNTGVKNNQILCLYFELIMGGNTLGFVTERKRGITEDRVMNNNPQNCTSNNVRNSQ